jgi:hypothetical protein
MSKISLVKLDAYLRYVHVLLPLPHNGSFLFLFCVAVLTPLVVAWFSHKEHWLICKYSGLWPNLVFYDKLLQAFF